MNTFLKVLMLVFLAHPLLAETPALIFSEPSFSGTGCSVDSVAFLATKEAFTLIFSNYLAERGPGIPRVENFSNCRIKTRVTVPAGYNAEVVSVDYRGFTRVENRTISLLVTAFKLGTIQVGSSPVKYFIGPKEVDFFKRDKPYFTRKDRCTKTRVVPLELNSYIAVLGDSSAQGVIALDSIDGVVEAKLSLRRCN